MASEVMGLAPEARAAVRRSGWLSCRAPGPPQVGPCPAVRAQGAACSPVPAGGYVRAEDAVGRAVGTERQPGSGRMTQGASGALALASSVGAGAGRGRLPCGPGPGAGGGRAGPCYPLPPPSLQVVLAPAWPGFGKVAGRGLLESCLLSRGLISKTGRLVLTEAADGTAEAPARLSSRGPPPPAPTLGGLPKAPALKYTGSHPHPTAPKLCHPVPTRPWREGTPAGLPTAGGCGGAGKWRGRGGQGDRLSRACLRLSFCK